MTDIIFICDPREFINTDNTKFTIEGISGKIDNTSEVIIGSNNSIRFQLKFWQKEGDSFKEKETIIGVLDKEYDIPSVGVIPIISGFFSTSKETIYQMATIVCGYYGYTLKPLEEQIYLEGSINGL